MKTSQEMVYLTNASAALINLYREDSAEGRELKRWIRGEDKRKFIKHAFNMKVSLENENRGVSLYHLNAASMIEAAWGRTEDLGFKYEIAVQDGDGCRIEMVRFTEKEEYIAKYIFLLCASDKYLAKQKAVVDQIIANDKIKHG